MKHFLVILLSLAILLQSNSRFFIVSGFYLNRDFIARNLCENRDKPQMKCCGKCYLKKQLKKDESSNSRSVPSKQEKAEAFVYLVPARMQIVVQVHSVSTLPVSFFQDHYKFSFLTSEFHPPSVA